MLLDVSIHIEVLLYVYITQRHWRRSTENWLRDTQVFGSSETVRGNVLHSEDVTGPKTKVRLIIPTGRI